MILSSSGHTVFMFFWDLTCHCTTCCDGHVHNLWIRPVEIKYLLQSDWRFVLRNSVACWPGTDGAISVSFCFHIEEMEIIWLLYYCQRVYWNRLEEVFSPSRKPEYKSRLHPLYLTPEGLSYSYSWVGAEQHWILSYITSESVELSIPVTRRGPLLQVPTSIV